MTEIVSTDVESEILYERARSVVEYGLRSGLGPRATVKDDAVVIATTALVNLLRWLRTLSARQLAVLLADEANRGLICVIHEPPEYTAAEMAGKFE